MPNPSVQNRPSEQRTAVEEVADRVSEISTLPAVAIRVLEVAKDPDAGAGDLKHAVEGDPAMSARILRTVNSASYGLSTHVTNLHQAISLLGFGQVRNLAFTASVSSIFRDDGSIGTYRREGLWQHLVSVGLCARLIAVRCRMSNFEDAFLAGLLHDIGIVLEDQHVHEGFVEVIESLDGTMTLEEAERKVLGFNHTKLGNLIAERWKFPSVIREAIEYHHRSRSDKGEHANLVRCVEIANIICSLKGITSVGMKLVKTPVELFQDAGFGKQDVAVLATDLDREIELNESLFDTD